MEYCDRVGIAPSQFRGWLNSDRVELLAYQFLLNREAEKNLGRCPRGHMIADWENEQGGPIHPDEAPMRLVELDCHACAHEKTRNEELQKRLKAEAVDGFDDTGSVHLVWRPRPPGPLVGGP